MSAKPYECLFQANLELDQNRVKITDLRPGSEDKEIWGENLNSIVCGIHLS
jgi:hypothetical protein